jgi:hypothetical protein
LGRFQSEINQRGFYQHWARMMDDHTPPSVPDMSRKSCSSQESA